MNSTAGGIVHDFIASSVQSNRRGQTGRQVNNRIVSVHGHPLDRGTHLDGDEAIISGNSQGPDGAPAQDANYVIVTDNFNVCTCRGIDITNHMVSVDRNFRRLRIATATAPGKECKKNKTNLANFHVTHYLNHAPKSKEKPCQLP